MTDSELKGLYQLEYLGLNDVDYTKLVDPFAIRTHDDIERPEMHLLRLMKNPEYFHFTCKHLFNIDLAPVQCVILREFWRRPFPMLIGSRGLGKSFLLGVYAVLRATLIQGRRIVITGFGFRQAKTVFNYAENIWHNSPMLRSLFPPDGRNGPHHDPDRWTLRLGDSVITALPMGDGSRVRGERAHDLLGDEFASIPWEIFETVFSGFAVVSLDPIARAKEMARIRVLKRMDRWTDEQEEEQRRFEIPNQTIISGTAYYQFNHFYKYWRRWKGIVESGGDPKRLRDALGEQFDEGLDYRDYSVIRIPVELQIHGHYDQGQLAKAKASIHSGIYMNEYNACFSADSKGFYKMSLIQTCVTNEPIIPDVKDADPVQFTASLKGDPLCRYIMGVDPAADEDNFAVVILEVQPTHRRVVYCWTTDKQRHKAKVEAKAIEGGDTYYSYCARKIRDLMAVFKIEIISLDAQGGGKNGVLEALHDLAKLKPGEQPIWIVTPDHPLSDGKERSEDNQPGAHMVELVQFAKADWVADANHGMKKDMEDRVLLFPLFDAVELESAFQEDQRKKRVFDTLEDCVSDIEELKRELATIQHEQTPGTLRDRWTTPEIKLPGMRKGRLRKDRYSALLMANSAARRLHRLLEVPQLEAHGGFVSGQVLASNDEVAGDMYVYAPEWFRKGTGDNSEHYGWAV